MSTDAVMKSGTTSKSEDMQTKHTKKGDADAGTNENINLKKVPKHNPNRVSFRQEIDTGEGFFPISNNSSNDASDGSNKQPRRKATRSATVGKADPVRDLGILVVIFGCFYLIARSFNNRSPMYIPGQHPEETAESDLHEIIGTDEPVSKSVLPSFHDMRQAFQDFMEAQDAKHPPRIDDCDLFLTMSSIPQTGWGIVVGRNYSMGESIFELPLPPPSFEITFDHSPDIPSMLEQNRIWVTPEALLLKHHPTLANVQTSSPLWVNHHTSNTSKTTNQFLVATKPIYAGEELFLDSSQHWESVLPSYLRNIPNLEDYEEANWIIQEARSTFRQFTRTHRGRNAKDVSVGPALRLLQRFVARHQPAAAKVLPTTLTALDTYRGKASGVNSLDMGLKQPSLAVLQRQGLCLADIEPWKSDSEAILEMVERGDGTRSEHQTTLQTKREFAQGDRVHPIPVIVKSKQDVGVCLSNEDASCEEPVSTTSSANDSCWSRRDLAIEICPLISSMSPSILKGLLDSTSQVSDQPDRLMNVELQWTSSWKASTSLTELSKKIADEKSERALSDQLESLALLEVVAARDLIAGENLVLANIDIPL